MENTMGQPAWGVKRTASAASEKPVCASKAAARPKG